MESNEAKLLGEAKISKLLLKFAIPSILSMVISALYNIVDQIFIGNSPELGALGNAATGIVFPLTWISMAIAFAIADGTAAFLSICSGRKDSESSHRAVGNSLVFGLIASLIYMLVCFLFMDTLLELFGAIRGETLELSHTYFTIVLCFTPASVLGLVLNAVARADGSPAFAMVGTLAGAITNIILDPIFIYVLKWGIAGAAWATIIGQVLTLVIGLFYLTRTKTFKIKFASFRLRISTLTNVIKLGISSFITQIAVVIVNLVVNASLKKFGPASEYGATIPIATMAICVKFFTIVQSVAIGIILGAQPILGYNIGAGKHDRVRKTFRLAVTTVIAVGVIMTALVELAPDLIINLFGVDSDLYLTFARLTFRIYLAGLTLTCLVKVISIFFQSVGEPIKATIVSLMRDIILFVPLALILPHIIGIEGVLWAAPLADVVSIIVAIGFTIYFFSHLGKNPRSPEQKAAIADSKPGVIITISREHGSQGKKIGELVAKQLGIPYYYKELTALAAEESGITSNYIKKVNSNDGEEISKELYLTTSPAKYAIEAQDAAIKEIARHGSCVIVGRAADYVLRNNKNILRVFIYAPKDYRIKNIMQMYKDDQKAAKKNIERSDKNRSDYYELISGQKWGDIRNYDLCIDASMGKDQVAKVILASINK